MLLKTPTQVKGVYTFLEVDSHTLHAIIYHICPLYTRSYELLVEWKYGWCVYAWTTCILILGYRSRHIFRGNLVFFSIVSAYIKVINQLSVDQHGKFTNSHLKLPNTDKMSLIWIPIAELNKRKI